MNKKTEKIILTLIFSAIFLVLIYFVVGEKEFTRWQKNRKKKSDLIVKVEQGENLISKIPREKKKFIAYTNTFADVNSKIINDAGFADFVSVVKAATDISGTKLNNIKPVNKAEIKRADGYFEKLIEFEVVEPYHEIGKLIEELVSSNTSMRIVELKLNTTDSDAHRAKITLGFLVKKGKK